MYVNRKHEQIGSVSFIILRFRHMQHNYHICVASPYYYTDMRIALQIITLLMPTLMDPPMDTSSFWKRLSMREIVATLPHSTFSSKERRSRALLDDAVTRLPADQRAMLNCAAISKFCDANLCDDTRNTTNVLRPTIINDSEDCFFETVSEDCRRDRITRFIDATGNKATAVAACAVCAGSFFVQELYKLRVSDLKTKTR